MTVRDIAHWLGLLGAKQIVVDTTNGWVRASCPLAPWYHEGGVDRHPSFGVKIADEKGVPFYHCFTCGNSGPLPRLQWQVSQLSGDRLLEASNLLSQNCLFGSEDTEPKKPKRIFF